MPLSEIVSWGAAGLALVLVALFASQSVRLRKLEVRYNALLSGTGASEPDRAGGAPSFVELIAGQGREIEKHSADLAALGQSAKSLQSAVQGSIQHVGLVRFNPFQETGGDQSFALALLDGKGDGVIISSLHSRTVTRFYAKPIKGGTSQMSLSEEEAKAVQQALGRG